MAELSPATRAIVAAFDARYELCGPFDDNWQELCLAAALMAAADQIIPYSETDFDGAVMVRNKLISIAEELYFTNINCYPNDSHKQ